MGGLKSIFYIQTYWISGESLDRKKCYFFLPEFKKLISDCKGVSEEELALHMTRAEEYLNAIKLKAVKKEESCLSSEGK